MFKAVNSISMIDFVKVKPTIVQCNEEWVDQLLATDLIESDGVYKIKGGYAPIYVEFSESGFPYVSFIHNDIEEDLHFQNVLEAYGLRCELSIIEGVSVHFTGHIEGNKNAEELAGFLVGFEQAYRKSLNAV